MKTLQGINDKVVVEIISGEEITDGGIILPETVKASPHSTGRIISMGENVSELKVGDIIIFAKFGGQATFLGKSEIRILCLSEIYGILKDCE